MTRFVLPGGGAGLLKKGNIDIDARLKVAVPVGNGQFASVRTVSWHLPPDIARKYGVRRPGGCEVLVPTVIASGGKWKIIHARGALDHFLRTGESLGFFDTPAHATAYANRLHLEQARKGVTRNR